MISLFTLQAKLDGAWLAWDHNRYRWDDTEKKKNADLIEELENKVWEIEKKLINKAT